MLDLDTHVVLYALAGDLSGRETSLVHRVPLVPRAARMRTSRRVPLIG
jgi:hypothetical protein